LISRSLGNQLFKNPPSARPPKGPPAGGQP
jgi:hypothetical protein